MVGKSPSSIRFLVVPSKSSHRKHLLNSQSILTGMDDYSTISRRKPWYVAQPGFNHEHSNSASVLLMPSDYQPFLTIGVTATVLSSGYPPSLYTTIATAKRTLKTLILDLETATLVSILIECDQERSNLVSVPLVLKCSRERSNLPAVFIVPQIFLSNCHVHIVVSLSLFLHDNHNGNIILNSYPVSRKWRPSFPPSLSATISAATWRQFLSSLCPPIFVRH
jgi:hypothetical protein